MNLSGKETLTMQVANSLEKSIMSGQYRPGSRLLSSRELSEKLGVTRIVVRSAVDVLEKKQLLVKSPRRGIYINSNLLSLNKIELYVMSYQSSSNTRQYSYVENTLNLYKDLNYRKRFNLTLRGLGWDEMNPDMFANELSKAKTVNAQVLVLSSAFLDAVRIQMLQDSGIPFLVIGELFHSVPNSRFNQVYESCAAKADAIGDFIRHSQYRNILYLDYPPGMMDFEDDYQQRLKEKLNGTGKTLNIAHLEITPGERPNYADRALKALYRFLQSGRRFDLLHIREIIEVDKVQEMLLRFDMKISDNLQLLTYPSVSDQTIIPGVLEKRIDYRDFATEVFARLEQICLNPEDIRQTDLSHTVKYTITDQNGRLIANLPMTEQAQAR